MPLDPDETVRRLYALALDDAASPEERRTAAFEFVKRLDRHAIQFGAGASKPATDPRRAQVERLAEIWASIVATRGMCPHPMTCAGCRGSVTQHETCWIKGPIVWHLGCYRGAENALMGVPEPLRK